MKKDATLKDNICRSFARLESKAAQLLFTWMPREMSWEDVPQVVTALGRVYLISFSLCLHFMLLHPGLWRGPLTHRRLIPGPLNGSTSGDP